MSSDYQPSNNYENNLGVNVTELLTKKYINWIYNYPEILQLDEDFNVIKVWSNKKDIASHFRKKIQGVELAIRKTLQISRLLLDC